MACGAASGDNATRGDMPKKPRVKVSPVIMSAIAEQDDLAARIERVRKLCDELDRALGTADEQRTLLAQMRTDADVVYRALIKKS